MGTNQEPHVEISGILDKRRQNLKFQWRTYTFTLAGIKLSYYKVGGSCDKEVGELWGVIDMREVLSVCVASPIGSRYPIEVTLRSGKIILLASDSQFERSRWLKALQEKLVLSKRRRSSDGPLVREQFNFAQENREWTSKSNTSSVAESPTCDEEVDVLGDMDSFIDNTFNGITYNRQSQIIKNDIQTHIPNQGANFR
ncbi:Hypothetical predicted protein [Pelobates cultripes]|uniref:PH domain-containing protein n=1 Tax=Pelobates cultripes TaxID=61616 RepID=A0AAD1WJ48_PELCU|nr:Hypothetical predicted protein [Pelobates cultripes]